jgi:hypothetical protein
MGLVLRGELASGCGLDDGGRGCVNRMSHPGQSRCDASRTR